MSVGTERGATGKNEPDTTAKYLFRVSEDVLVEEGRLVSAFRPLQFVLVREIEDGLSKCARFFHFLVYSFGNAVENKLKQAPKLAYSCPALSTIIFIKFVELIYLLFYL